MIIRYLFGICFSVCHRHSHCFSLNFIPFLSSIYSIYSIWRGQVPTWAAPRISEAFHGFTIFVSPQSSGRRCSVGPTCCGVRFVDVFMADWQTMVNLLKRMVWWGHLRMVNGWIFTNLRSFFCYPTQVFAKISNICHGFIFEHVCGSTTELTKFAWHQYLLVFWRDARCRCFSKSVEHVWVFSGFHACGSVLKSGDADHICSPFFLGTQTPTGPTAIRSIRNNTWSILVFYSIIFIYQTILQSFPLSLVHVAMVVMDSPTGCCVSSWRT